MDADEVPFVEDDPDGNEYFNINANSIELVPHIPIPKTVREAVRCDYRATDDAYYYNHVMLLSLQYGHVTAGTPLPSVLQPNMDSQNPESNPFDFH